MKKMKTIPFDLAMAKGIHEGKLEGEIVTRQGTPVEILGFDLNIIDGDIAFITLSLEGGQRVIEVVDKDGFGYPDHEEAPQDLLLRVPDVTQTFKPFDRVLVRDGDGEYWRCNLFSHIDNRQEYPYACLDGRSKYCIPYEGNESLVGTTNQPKNE